METAMHGSHMWLRLLGECDVGTPTDGSTEVLVGSTAWTNKALCVFKRKSALPYYQFQKWFSGNDISDKHSTLVSALMRETAALNSSNLCIPIFMDVSATSPGAAWPSVLLLACNHPSLAGFITAEIFCCLTENEVASHLHFKNSRISQQTATSINLAYT